MSLPLNYDLSSRFCYFLDLNDPNVPAKQTIYNWAEVNLVNQVAPLLNQNQEKGKENDNIKTAIQFLKDVARSERNKELRIKIYILIKID